MAKTIVITDDLDSSLDGARTVTFSLDGRRWEIDLAPKNFEALEKALMKYIEKASEVEEPPPEPTSIAKARRGGVPKRDPELTKTIRAWAQETNQKDEKTGRPVGAKGRIPESVVQAYEAAH